MKIADRIDHRLFGRVCCNCSTTDEVHLRANWILPNELFTALEFSNMSRDIPNYIKFAGLL